MSRYLLPCSCGKSSSISAAQAGETITCSCGKRLEVPTLRGLRDLERVEPDAATLREAGRTWEDRHRVAFVLVVIAVAALGTAGYLAARLPAKPVFISADNAEEAQREAEEKLRNSSGKQVLDLYEELKRGLSAGPPIESTEETRQLMLWCMGIAGGVALASLGGAGVALAGGHRRGR